MNNFASTATILIATDSVSDAALVKNLLQSEFKNIFVSTDPDKVPGDFVRHMPDVLVLAFDTLAKSERYYVELHRMGEEVQHHPHRTIVLCNKDEIRQVYELCKKDYFDDYMLFWPMAHDSSRLAMFIHRALRELASLNINSLNIKGPSAAELAAQARTLAGMETLLGKQLAQCNQYVDAASLAISQAAQEIGTALDGFSQRLSSGAFPELLEVKNPEGLKNQISQFKRDEIQPHVTIAAESTQPLKQWVQEFRDECTPLMQSASILNAMADSIQPIVLVVDDNEAQRTMIGKLLLAENYNLLFAKDGVEALSILSKTQPDLILMDIMMPNMNGIDAARRLKLAPQFANTPIIMITGNSEERVVANCMQAGAADFIVKPFVHATLLSKIANALHRKQKVKLTENVQQPA